MQSLSQNLPLVILIALVVLLLVARGLRFFARKRLRAINNRTRDKMIAIASAHSEYVSVDVASVEGLNREELAEYTSELEQLGFQKVMDYRLRRSDSAELRGFERVFANPQAKCFAGILTGGQLGPQQPLYVAINSHLEDGWNLGTSNVPARIADYFLRQPRILRMRYPDDSVEKLFERHLERRREILEGLGIQVSPDISIDAYMARVRQNAQGRKEKVQTANPLGDLPLAEAQASARNQEWLGDYPAEAKRLREQKKPLTP